jgi:hypothetical protein
MTTEEKLIALQRSPEMKKAMLLLTAFYQDCELKSFVRLTYTIDNLNYELTFLPIAHQVNIDELNDGKKEGN